MQEFYTLTLNKGKKEVKKQKGYIEEIGGHQIGFYKYIDDIHLSAENHYNPITIWYPIDLESGLSLINSDDKNLKLDTRTKSRKIIEDRLDRMNKLKATKQYKKVVEEFEKLVSEEKEKHITYL